jgi:ABC-type Na+ efflux pump permease subunit
MPATSIFTWCYNLLVLQSLGATIYWCFAIYFLSVCIICIVFGLLSTVASRIIVGLMFTGWTTHGKWEAWIAFECKIKADQSLTDYM